MSVEAHGFRRVEAVDWAGGFQPDTVEVCLNLEGEGWLRRGGCSFRFGPGSIGYYRIGRGAVEGVGGGVGGCSAERAGRQAHRFLTLSYSVAFLRDHLAGFQGALNPGVRRTVFGDAGSVAGGVVAMEARPMRQSERDFCRSLELPPHCGPGVGLYYRAKALELVAREFFASEDEASDFFCVRQQRLAVERVARVRTLLAERFDEPPTLAQLGRAVGCSPSYLSRLFSEATGLTISQYLRSLRIEKAAELLVSGRFNVSEAAVEVGYRSLSHFSKAFREVKGCSPSDYNG